MKFPLIAAGLFCVIPQFSAAQSVTPDVTYTGDTTGGPS
jgi:hypothetical protein